MALSFWCLDNLEEFNNGCLIPLLMSRQVPGGAFFCLPFQSFLKSLVQRGASQFHSMELMVPIRWFAGVWDENVGHYTASRAPRA